MGSLAGIVQLEQVLWPGVNWDANGSLFEVDMRMAKRWQSVHTVSAPGE
jgi:hypothetical protein